MTVSSLIKLRDRGGEREVGAYEVERRVSVGKVLGVGACGVAWRSCQVAWGLAVLVTWGLAVLPGCVGTGARG